MKHKYPSSNCFTGQLLQTFKEITPILQDFFQTMEKEIPLAHFENKFNQVKAYPEKGRICLTVLGFLLLQ